MNREPTLPRTISGSHIGTAEMSLAMWLRNGRAQKNLSLDDVARITKIQTRILDRLEAGRLDGLPAEVFVKGFVRSFARCVGLDEDEALRRYTACLKDGAPKAPPVAAARALSMIDAMGELAPNARARVPQAPQILRDEPGFAAGSMEIPSVGDAADVVDAGDAGDVVDVELPAETSFTDLPAFAAAVDGLQAVQTTEANETSETSETSDETVNAMSDAVDAVVVAPPADIDLSAEISVPLEATPAKKKRTRKATSAGALTDGAPKRRRKVATGTPVEPVPVVSAAMATDSEAEPVEPAPKRRRKPRGSVQPPVVTPAVEVAQAAETVDAVEAVVEQAAVAVELPVETTTVSTVPVEDHRSVFELGHAEGEISVPVEHALAVESAMSIEVAETSETAETESSTTRFERVDDAEGVAPVQLAWTPRMPPFAVTAPPSWRKSPAQPALVAVIDDADPEGAERLLEDRRAGERRRTFLPPILLDRDGDRSGRQGGLTLAVIILLIAATLTLSYLMRRPSASGDGVTLDDTTETTRSIG